MYFATNAISACSYVLYCYTIVRLFYAGTNFIARSEGLRGHNPILYSSVIRRPCVRPVYGEG